MSNYDIAAQFAEYAYGGCTTTEAYAAYDKASEQSRLQAEFIEAYGALYRFGMIAGHDDDDLEQREALFIAETTAWNALQAHINEDMP